MRVEPATTSGPTSGTTHTSTSSRRAQIDGPLQRPAHVRRRAGRRDAEHEVVRAHVLLIDLRRTVLGPILGALLAADQRDLPARYESLHHLGLGAEGRRALRRIQNPQPAARPGAHVDQPAAALEAPDSDLDRPRDLLALRAHRLGDAPILRVYQVDDLQRVREVYVDRSRVSLLGQPGIEEVVCHSPQFLCWSRDGGAPVCFQN
jgi:hypothetical protein